MTAVALTFLLVRLTAHVSDGRKYMRITFQHTESSEIGNQNTVRQNEAPHHEVTGTDIRHAYGVAYGRHSDNNWIAGRASNKERGKTLTQLQQEAGTIDVAIQQDYRTVLSHTMSSEDYAKMEEEGFDFSAMEPGTAVTIVDKIKAELARSGQYIAGYTDDLDGEVLAQALGSDTLARAVENSFREADIPMTEENLYSVKRAWDMTVQLKPPTEGTINYMVDNGMEPELWNFYLSQSSGAGAASDAEKGLTGSQPRFYAEEIQGYYSENAKGDSHIDMTEEIDKILRREGLLPKEENRQTAEALLAGGLPITKENLELWQELESVQLPISEHTFAQAAAAAIAEGKDPIHSNPAQTVSVYERAAELLRLFENPADNFPQWKDVSSRRILEEIRLRMSAEVNVKLLRSGFAIDTAPMEELVEVLRKMEKSVAQQYFPEDAQAVPKYELYRDVNHVVAEIPGLPASLLGTWSAKEHPGTLSRFHAEGRSLQDAFAKAKTDYETLMTAPRKDLGDSIRKAFANVDDILQDMGYEATEANRRAVRILGYNRMTIDASNIERVQKADAQVQTVTEKMTPASVLRMIRDGRNPLEMSFAELEDYFDSLPRTYEDTAESYSRFLYGLEKNKQITEQEKTAYIGIYRMLHQLDASDGSAVGALVNTGAELHFSNLLSAVRSGKFKSLDVSVTEDFGTTVEIIRKGESITEQIARGFADTTREVLTAVSHSEEAMEAYRQRNLEQLRQAADVSAESVELLMRSKLPLCADNLLAAQALTDSSRNPFKDWELKKTRQLQQRTEKPLEASELTEALENKEDFRNQYFEMLDGVDNDLQTMTLQADNSMDVRSMQLLHKQLSVAAGAAREEEYIFPMYVGEELTKVHLVLDKTGAEKGSVTVAIDLSETEHLEGHFLVSEGKITGFLLGNTENAVTKLKKTADIFTDSVINKMDGEWEVGTLPVVAGQDGETAHRRQASVNREVSGGEEADREVDNTELYRIAKVFLEAVQK